MPALDFVLIIKLKEPFEAETPEDEPKTTLPS